LFALPFAAVGLFAAAQVVGKLAVGDWRTAGFLSIFAVVFGGGWGSDSRSQRSLGGERPNAAH
jgi:hypothetical protein